MRSATGWPRSRSAARCQLRRAQPGRAARRSQVTLERAPEGASATELSIGGRSPFAGAKVADLSPRLAQRLGMRSETKGVAMVDIDRNSPAAGFGFQPRDIVREVNGEEIDTAEEAASRSPSSRLALVAFHVERDGQAASARCLR